MPAFLAPLLRMLKLVPPKAWLAIGLTVALFVGFLVHQHKAKAFGRERYAAGERAAYARIEAKALALAKRGEEIAAKLREQTNEQNRRIAADADALRLRGPGNAACSAAVPAASGGHQPPGRPADAPLARVPYPEWQQLIGLPFTDSVAFAKQCDLNRAEALTWREWHRMQGSKP